MKIEKVEGIIISETNYSESSKILNVLTKEYGLIGIISKGCRNIKSKLRGVSRKLVHGNFNIYYKENSLSTLISIDVINSLSKTIMDLEKVSYASYIIELVGQVVKQNDDNEIYDLLKNTLLKIEDGLNPLILTNILELKLLNYLGVSASVDACSVCGSKKGIVTLDSTSGGYLCRNCYTNQGMVSEEAIKTIRMYYYVDISNISKVDIKDSVSREINRFLDDYYDRYTGLYLKSKSFIQEVNKLNINN